MAKQCGNKRDGRMARPIARRRAGLGATTNRGMDCQLLALACSPMRLDLYHALFPGLVVAVAALPPVFDALDQGERSTTGSLCHSASFATPLVGRPVAGRRAGSGATTCRGMDCQLLAFACSPMRLDLCHVLFPGQLIPVESPGHEWRLELVSSIVLVERALALRG